MRRRMKAKENVSKDDVGMGSEPQDGKGGGLYQCSSGSSSRRVQRYDVTKHGSIPFT